MHAEASSELAVAAAALVVEEGLEYGDAKRRAARAWQHGGGQRVTLPSDEQVEDEVRTHLALYHADTQPAELRALREVALAVGRPLAEFRPHLGGAAWRGTATRQSALRIDLYCDDSKSAEIALINLGWSYDTASQARPNGPPIDVLTLDRPCPALGERVTVHLIVRDLTEIRGALKPDPRGRSWRGDMRALQALLETDTPLCP